MITQKDSIGDSTVEFRIDETVPEVVGFTVSAGPHGATLSLGSMVLALSPDEIVNRDLLASERVPCVRVTSRSGRELLQFPYRFSTT